MEAKLNIGRASPMNDPNTETSDNALETQKQLKHQTQPKTSKNTTNQNTTHQSITPLDKDKFSRKLELLVFNGEVLGAWIL